MQNNITEVEVQMLQKSEELNRLNRIYYQLNTHALVGILRMF